MPYADFLLICIFIVSQSGKTFASQIQLPFHFIFAVMFYNFSMETNFTLMLIYYILDRATEASSPKKYFEKPQILDHCIPLLHIFLLVEGWMISISHRTHMTLPKSFICLVSFRSNTGLSKVQTSTMRQKTQTLQTKRKSSAHMTSHQRYPISRPAYHIWSNWKCVCR